MFYSGEYILRRIYKKYTTTTHSSILGFPCGSAGKKFTFDVGYLGLISGLGRSPREGKGYPLQYSGLENSMDRIVHRVAKSQAPLSDLHFHFSFGGVFYTCLLCLVGFQC